MERAAWAIEIMNSCFPPPYHTVPTATRDRTPVLPLGIQAYRSAAKTCCKWKKASARQNGPRRWSIDHRPSYYGCMVWNSPQKPHRLLQEHISSCPLQSSRNPAPPQESGNRPDFHVRWYAAEEQSICLFPKDGATMILQKPKGCIGFVCSQLSAFCFPAFCDIACRFSRLHKYQKHH